MPAKTIVTTITEIITWDGNMLKCKDMIQSFAPSFASFIVG
uniref:Uncharacterized protein n=1 Tax=Rhizophora mucronata TaxID=61149 RepID=A0A2P2R0A9_RHIMU